MKRFCLIFCTLGLAINVFGCSKEVGIQEKESDYYNETEDNNIDNKGIITTEAKQTKRIYKGDLISISNNLVLMYLENNEYTGYYLFDKNGELVIKTKERVSTGFDTYLPYFAVEGDAFGNGGIVDILDSKGNVIYTEPYDSNTKFSELLNCDGHPIIKLRREVKSIDGDKDYTIYKDIVTGKSFEWELVRDRGTLDYVGSGILICKKEKTKPRLYNINTGTEVDLEVNPFAELHGPFSEEGILTISDRNNVSLIDTEGNIIYQFPSNGKLLDVGCFSDGLVYIDKAFYNINGEKVIDLNTYNVCEKQNVNNYYWNGYKGFGWPYFKNGYACMNIKNPDGVLYAAVINRNGDFMFEPVRGEMLLQEIMNDVVFIKKENSTEESCYNLRGEEVWSNGYWFNMRHTDGLIIDTENQKMYDYDGKMIDEFYEMVTE